MSASIQLEHQSYAPGTVLRGRIALRPPPGDESKKVELSVLWETEGKGDTDLGVILCHVLCDGDPVAGSGEHAFEVELPALPLSYQGHLLKIGWRVRVRRLHGLSDDTVVDAPFQLEWPA